MKISGNTDFEDILDILFIEDKIKTLNDYNRHLNNKFWLHYSENYYTFCTNRSATTDYSKLAFYVKLFFITFPNCSALNK